MRSLQKLLLCLLVLSFGSAHAAAGTDVGILFGMKNATFDTETAGVEFKSKSGFVAGVLAVGEMGGMLFRTGGYYATRATEIKGTPNAELTIATIDVPVTLMYQFNDMLSMFGGAVFALKVSDDCSGNTAICNGVSDDIESFHTAATIGLNAKFHPNWSGEVSYEHGLSDIAEDTSMSAISLGAVFIY